jgi:hypothetical protein
MSHAWAMSISCFLCSGLLMLVEHAAAASTPMVRDNFLSLAQSWMRLARELDASERLLTALEETSLERTPSPKTQGTRPQEERY